MNSRRCESRLRMLARILLIAVLVILTAADGDTAEDGRWSTVRKICLLALLVVTWVLIVACVAGGADLCVHLARHLGLHRAEKMTPDIIDRPAKEIKIA